MSSARSRKKRSRSSVKLFPLYKHPQDAPPQGNPPQCQCIVGDFFCVFGGLGALPSTSIFRVCYDTRIACYNGDTPKRGKMTALCSGPYPSYNGREPD